MTMVQRVEMNFQVHWTSCSCRVFDLKVALHDRLWLYFASLLQSVTRHFPRPSALDVAFRVL
jgi:hypothetical protein